MPKKRVNNNAIDSTRSMWPVVTPAYLVFAYQSNWNTIHFIYSVAGLAKSYCDTIY